MKLTKWLAVAVLFTAVQASAQVQYNCPMSVSGLPTTHDDGTGPYNFPSFFGAAASTGKGTLVGNGYGPGQPYDSRNLPEGYNEVLAASGGSVRRFLYDAAGYFRLTSLSGNSGQPATGPILIEQVGSLFNKFVWNVFIGSDSQYHLEFDEYIQQTTGTYTKTALFSTPVSLPIYMSSGRHVNVTTPYVYYRFSSDGVNWTLNSVNDPAPTSAVTMGFFVAGGDITGGHSATAQWDSMVIGPNGYNGPNDPFEPYIVQGLYEMPAGLFGAASYAPVFQAGSLTVGPTYINGYLDTPVNLFGYTCPSSITYDAPYHTIKVVDTTTNTTILTTQPQSTGYTCGPPLVASCPMGAFDDSIQQSFTAVSGHNYNLYSTTHANVDHSIGNTAFYTVTTSFSVP